MRRSSHYITSWVLCVAGILLGFALSMRTAAAPQSGGVITGQVLLPNGSPLVNVRVGAVPAAAGGSQTLMAQTDREGHYRLANVPPGSYFLLVDPLEAAVYFPGVTDRAGATPVTVTAGATVADRNFQLKAPLTMRVSGRVIRDGHQAGAQVALRGSVPPVLTAAIGPDDSFEFANVRPGTYQAQVNPAVGAAPLTVVVSDKDVTGLEIVVPLSAVTDVTVLVSAVVENGGPLPRLQLTFMPVAGNPGVPSNGRNVALSGTSQRVPLPVGEYRVTQPANAALVPLPPGYSIKSISAGGADLMKDTLKVTPAGVPPITVTIGVSTPTPFIKLAGKVTGLDKAPLKADTITMTTSFLAAPLTASIKPDGSFEFPMVLTGTYQARLTPSTDTLTRTITVGVTDMLNIEIPLLLPTVTISGRVAPAPPVQANQPNLPMLLRPDGGNGGAASNAQVGIDGSFSFPNVRAGNYTLTFPCPPDLCSAPPVPVTVTDKDLTNVIVAMGPPARGGPRGVPTNAAPNRGAPPNNNRGTSTASPTATVVISGKVSTEIGAPLPKFRLRFTSGAVTRSLAINDEVFSAQLPPGAHQVAVADLPAGYVVKTMTDGATDLRSGMLVADPTAGALGPGTTAPRIAITLGVSSPPPWVKISGKLTGLSGAPPVGASVNFTGTLFTGALVAPVKPDGSFEVPTALPDTYTVRMTPDNGAGTRTITVGASGLTNLELNAGGARANLGEFIKIQPGEFQMGCGQPQCGDEAKPAHTVRITKAFEIGKHEVTQAEWQAVMGSNPSNFKGDGRPVDYVSWTDAHQFLDKLNTRRDGYRYRLPTEAEWEYAARAGGDAGAIEATAWFEANSNLETHPAGQKKPNAWGLFDMRGNVAEWVEDWYAKYTDGAAADPQGPATGREHVLRGGSWFSQPATADVSSRDRLDPAQRSDRVGLRLVREASPGGK